MKSLTTRRLPLLGAAGLMAVGVGVAPAIAMAEPPSMSEAAGSASSCKQVRADYANGIAKTKKSANRAVANGYKRPFVCIRVYRQLAPALDPNGNKVVCERR